MKRYTEAFKAEVVRSVLDEYQPIMDVCDKYGIPHGTIGAWLSHERALRRQRAAQARAEKERAEAAMLPKVPDVSVLEAERDRLRAYSLKLEKGFDQILDIITDLTE